MMEGLDAVTGFPEDEGTVNFLLTQIANADGPSQNYINAWMRGCVDAAHKF